jgi:hypothetical protein
MLAETEEGFRAYVEIINDRSFAGLSPAQILGSVTNAYQFSFVIIVDDVAMADQDHPVLALDLFHEPGRSFRAVPAMVQAIDNNLSLANMDFFEFSDAVDGTGVFRGFG